MTREGLLQLLAGAPLMAFCGRGEPATPDGDMLLHLGPGRYTIGAGGGISVLNHAIRIEGCTFEASTIETADLAETTDSALNVG